ncbi:hypothetical protein [Methylocystis sp.]|uniref:hypothetical protein n=1 Tax=Methylocystis sp. TaxID=1911079 RepID=UPI003DA33CEA
MKSSFVSSAANFAHSSRVIIGMTPPWPLMATIYRTSFDADLALLGVLRRKEELRASQAESRRGMILSTKTL